MKLTTGHTGHLRPWKYNLMKLRLKVKKVSRVNEISHIDCAHIWKYNIFGKVCAAKAHKDLRHRIEIPVFSVLWKLGLSRSWSIWDLIRFLWLEGGSPLVKSCLLSIFVQFQNEKSLKSTLIRVQTCLENEVEILKIKCGQI